MKNKLSYLWICLLMGLFPSCTTVQIASFERLQPASINFPEQIRRVGVVNAMPVVQQANLEKGYSVNVLEGDGVLTTDALAREIAATDYFDKVVICDSAIWQKALPMEAPLSVTQVDSLTRMLDVDMLLVMERVHVQLAEGIMVIPGLMNTVSSIDGVVTPLLRAYVPGRNAPLFSISKSDTICWEKGPDLTMGQILKDASEYAATMPMEKLLPYWMEVQRYYFDGGNVEMRDAGVYVREQNWEEASVLWKEVYDKKKGKAKMRAAYNLAVYSEMINDFEAAKAYLDAASALLDEGSWEQQLILAYQFNLEKEHQKNQRLNVQMKRFEP
jgi:hypothetical protein